VKPPKPSGTQAPKPSGTKPPKPSGTKPSVTKPPGPTASATKPMQPSGKPVPQVPGPNAPNTPASEASKIASLVQKYETSNRGSAFVSSGKGDHGGVSYGTYQLSTTMGSAKSFVNSADFPFKSQFAGLQPGTSAFSSKWSEVAKANPQAFRAAEDRYVTRTSYQPFADRTMARNGLDLNKMSPAVKAVALSTVTQHGGGNGIFNSAVNSMKASGKYNQNSPTFQSDLIKAVYAERGRTDASGRLVHFKSSSANMQKGVASRFVREQADALKLLNNK